jgi:NAD(P)-dependent dehydrogenase (short-subunit alcohol dehydrogenase family)
MSKAALVTGAARRIGRSIAEALSREGYAVALHCHVSTDDAHGLAAQIRQQGGLACVVEADLADPAEVEGLVERAAREIGPIDLLVNNASQFSEDALESLDRAKWDRHFAVNLQAPVFLARDMARLLPSGRDGCIVNILDQRVWKPTPRFFSYTVSKAALWSATRTMAQALAPRIRVNAVGPGPTVRSQRQTREDFARQEAAVLLERGPRPEEIAEAVLFLARAASVTGQMIAVDGGQHLVWQTPDVTGIEE